MLSLRAKSFCADCDGNISLKLNTEKIQFSSEDTNIFGESVLLLSQIEPLAASPALLHPQLCTGHRSSLCLFMLFLVKLAPWPQRTAVNHPEKVHSTQTVKFTQSSGSSGLFLLSFPLVNRDNKVIIKVSGRGVLVLQCNTLRLQITHRSIGGFMLTENSPSINNSSANNYCWHCFPSAVNKSVDG